jgi:cyclase
VIGIRVIPCLLLRNRGLVKTIKFRKPKYVGDPINAIRIFNDKAVDELVFLDTTVTVEHRSPNFELISEIAEECFMPICYGGGVSKLDQVERLFRLGVEKVAINTAAIEDRELVRSAASTFGSQSIVVSLDVKRNRFGNYRVFTHGGSLNTRLDPLAVAIEMEQLGAGEILLNSIDRDGTMAGYDLNLTRSVAERVGVPVIACGGAGKLDDFLLAVNEGKASAVAAGSFFVFQGPHQAVLITYPTSAQLKELWAD